jgi:hypothetical protein
LLQDPVQRGRDPADLVRAVNVKTLREVAVGRRLEGQDGLG